MAVVLIRHHSSKNGDTITGNLTVSGDVTGNFIIASNELHCDGLDRLNSGVFVDGNNEANIKFISSGNILHAVPRLTFGVDSQENHICEFNYLGCAQFWKSNPADPWSESMRICIYAFFTSIIIVSSVTLVRHFLSCDGQSIF